jgi:hypothetical protein
MRIPVFVAAFLLAAAPAAAQDAFDACEVFTKAEAESALGTSANPEPVNPKVKRPKVVPTCTYWTTRDGKPWSASATYRFAKTEQDLQRAFDEERLRFQTKPMLLAGGSGYWSAKQGQLHLRKGRTWLTVAVGPAAVGERDPEHARKLAEMLARKL